MSEPVNYKNEFLEPIILIIFVAKMLVIMAIFGTTKIIQDTSGHKINEIVDRTSKNYPKFPILEKFEPVNFEY